MGTKMRTKSLQCRNQCIGMEPEGKCLKCGRDVQINLQLFQQVRTKCLLSDKQNKLYFLSPLNRKGKYRFTKD